MSIRQQTEPEQTVRVEIYNQTYSIRSDGDNDYIHTLAEYVDRKMREVAQHVKGDSARIAVLAALNLADELFRVQKQQEGERVEIREKVAELTEELSQALSG